MSQINPFSGSILQSTDVQRTQAAAKDQQLRRMQNLEKNAALADDQLQHEVESSEAIVPANDQQPRRQQRRRKGPRRDAQDASSDNSDSPHIDLTA